LRPPDGRVIHGPYGHGVVVRPAERRLVFAALGGVAVARPDYRRVGELQEVKQVVKSVKAAGDMAYVDDGVAAYVLLDNMIGGPDEAHAAIIAARA
jgi:hypothetical protein